LREQESVGGDPPETIRLRQTASSDPGDETERNYRYQHQYGVVLLAGVRRGTLPYVSLYCEYHEDFLGERRDGRFDGWQIKTSKPEGGAWKLTSPALVKSIGRFIELLEGHPDEIGEFRFVSNSAIDTVTSASTDDARRGRCPGLMLQHIAKCSTANEVADPFRKAFDNLAAELGATPERLFDVLGRLSFIKGPSREEFDAALAHEHLGGLSECQHLNAAELNTLRDELVAMFHRAASLHVTDPDRHLLDLLSGKNTDPATVAKRIICANVSFATAVTPTKTFAYQGQPRIKPGSSQPGVLEQKLERGGLVDMIEYMKAREQAAEYQFLEEQAKDPMTAAHQLRQVEEAVHGECLEAYLAAKASAQAPFGPTMFNDISSRLRRLESERKQLLGGSPYEVLMGTAALLTTECRLWWSDRFRLKDRR
jgi:hypothetical protein